MPVNTTHHDSIETTPAATAVTPAGEARSDAPARPGRSVGLVRIAARVLLVLMIGGAGAFEVNVATNPSVARAPAIVKAIDVAHHATPATVAPQDRIAIALVASEDATFYSNNGVEVPALVRAFWGYLTGTDTGGSTIEMQLAHLLFPAATQGFWGHVHRVSLALQFDTHFTKGAILSMYLSAVYFGHGYWGIRAASEGYFGVAPAALTWAQAALLAGIVQAPSALDPVHHLAAARRRMDYVLGRLVGTGVLTESQASVIARSDLGLLGPASVPGRSS
ncbi:MAG: biosynthetic peptidoglycan transglycosylase [Candidatus Dormiibacterota bacterium]